MNQIEQEQLLTEIRDILLRIKENTRPLSITVEPHIRMTKTDSPPQLENIKEIIKGAIVQ